MQKITPCLWFDNNALEACQFYTSVFPDSSIKNRAFYDENNTHWNTWDILTIDFSILNTDFLAINWWPYFKFTPATSFMIPSKNQEEIEYYYDKLSVSPDAEQCGWLLDKYWLSWQLIPENLNSLLSSPDKIKSWKVMKALMEMKRIDINKLEDAYNS